MGKKNSQSHLPKYLRDQGGGGGGKKNSTITSTSASSSFTTTAGSSSSNGTTTTSSRPSLSAVLTKIPNSYRQRAFDYFMKMQSPVLNSEWKRRCEKLEQLKDEFLRTFFSHEDVALQESIEINYDLIVNLEDCLHRCGNLLFHYEDKNYFFLYSGLDHACKICLHAFRLLPSIESKSSDDKCQIIMDKLFSTLSYIFFKLSKYSRGRLVLNSHSMFHILWSIEQSYLAKARRTARTQSTLFKVDVLFNPDVESLLYHIRETMTVLHHDQVMNEEYFMLLTSANKQWFNDSTVTVEMKLVDNFGSETVDVFIAVLDIPELKEWNQFNFNNYMKSSNMTLQLEDFDIRAHFSIVASRTGTRFLNLDYFVKWESRTNHEQKNQFHEISTPGYYILRQDKNISKLALMKFLEFIYTDTFSKLSQDVDFMEKQAKALEISIDECEEQLVRNMNQLGSCLSNPTSKQTLKMISETFPSQKVSRMGILSGSQFNSLYDSIDVDMYCVELYNMSPYNSPLKYEPISLLSKGNCVEHDLFCNAFQQSERMFSDLNIIPNVACDLIDSCITNEYYKKAVETFVRKGHLSVHKCILAARSEYLRKVFQYECPTVLDESNGTEHIINRENFHIENLSFTSLFIITKYIYGGLGVFTQHAIPVECLVEIFVAADMYLLFPLKKYVEELIVEYVKNVKLPKGLKNPSENENSRIVQEVYELSIIYNSYQLKHECSKLLSEHFPDLMK
ncbi:hypothetical protein FDP41_007047 [Naegleria fowleri]|uniref:BTB domain-containing protein n=1 Tax=Naegleria fowleri TaxID=5763 RepID=A0A6A5BHZ7_NAEFO|nr:uncharacterized protein FDP41_007047 [Naegleria fowleri]KAF0973660.1 hypothetical protein FDP41_007047 [Naegleria fowleri]CAG4714314.1 unnamed protein product [Naegleria fowleri]